MQLPVQTFSGLIENMVAGVQGSAAQLLDFSVGSVLRALMEACGAVALWLQWLILQVLSATRAATSQGPDLDSWMADFSLTRLAGSAAQGIVTFSRYTPGVAATIPVATNLLTLDGTVGFTVIAQSTNPAWNGTNGYSLAAGLLSVNVPVSALVVGSAGNVMAGAIGLISMPLPGIDAVTNSAALQGGMSAETDAAFRARFQLYINSRSLATAGAIAFAIASVQQGLRYLVLENQNNSGLAQPGNFCVTVDDGTGAPSDTLLASVQAAVDVVRPIGSTFSVAGPQILDVTVVASIETSNAMTHAAVAASAQANIAAWIETLPVGGTLAISKMDALIHDTDPSVVSVTSLRVNNGVVDVTAAKNGILMPISVTVS